MRVFGAPVRLRSMNETGDDMPLDESYRRGVVFIIGDGWDYIAKKAERKPVGTGFLILVPDESNTDKLHAYVVTAAHVVRKRNAIEVRVRTESQTVIDIPVSEWAFHDTDDVAVAEIQFDPAANVEYRAVMLDDALDRQSLLPRPGERVYFLGLLDGVPEMGKEMIPMVRSGTLAAYNQPGIPLEKSKTTTAHLIDCRSFRGFSGSPCFVQFDVWVKETSSGTIAARQDTRLMGVLTGHYDDIERQKGQPTLELHIGVGVVVPIERVRDVVEGSKLRGDRLKSATPVYTREITADAVLAPSEVSEWDQFANVTRFER